MFFEKKRAFFKKKQHILCENEKYNGKCCGYIGFRRVDEDFSWLSKKYEGRSDKCWSLRSGFCYAHAYPLGGRIISAPTAIILFTCYKEKPAPGKGAGGGVLLFA